MIEKADVNLKLDKSRGTDTGKTNSTYNHFKSKQLTLNKIAQKA